MAEIPLVGLPSSDRLPGGYLQIRFAQGPASAALQGRQAVIVMPQTASGTATAGTLYDINNEQDIITRAGVGSPAHRAARLFLKANKFTKLSYLGMDATAAGSPVAAAGTIVLVNAATGAGTLVVWIAGERIDVRVDSGDSITTIGDNLEAAINSKTHLPCTASNAAGTVTVTARIAGTSQGDGTTGVIRTRAEITTGIGTTVTVSGAALGLGTGTAGAEGTTTEAAQLATALAGIEAVRKYYIITQTINTDGLTNLVSHITNKSYAVPGLRSTGVTGYTGTLAAGQALSVAQNYERLSILAQPNSEHDTAELAGNFAAVLALQHTADVAYNFDGYRSAAKGWFVKAANDAADWPTFAEANAAINDGLTVALSDDNGSSMAMWITSRSKNSAGTVDDSRASEGHRISVADDFSDALLAYFALNFENFKLKPDELLADGTVNTNQRVGPKTTTPSLFKGWQFKQLDDYEEAELIQDAVGSKESLNVVIDPSNGGRLENGLQLHVINLLHQATWDVAEVSGS